MKLYHGTTPEVAKHARQTGLKPRNYTKVSNWQHTVESNPKMVYLSSAYAPYFGLCAANMHIGLVEVETDCLPQRWFRPDEDFVEQVTRGSGNVSGMLKDRTAWVRDNIDSFATSWRVSVDTLGNCAYKGAIPPSAITKVSLVDFTGCAAMAVAAFDPTITNINYRLYGDFYKLITRWCCGYEVLLDEFLNAGFSANLQVLPDDQVKAMRELWAGILGSQGKCVKCLT